MGGVPESSDDCRSANDFVFRLSSSWQSTAWLTQSEEVNSWLIEVSLTTNGPLSPLDMYTNHHASYRLDTGGPGGIECSVQFKGLLYQQIWSCGLIHASQISLLRPNCYKKALVVLLMGASCWLGEENSQENGASESSR
jgi:hypothetical protein